MGMPIGGCSALTAEALAIKEAIRKAIKMNLANITVESGSHVAMLSIRGKIVVPKHDI